MVFMEPWCSFSLHQPVLDLALLSGTLVLSVTLFCTFPCLCKLLFARFPAASGRCSRPISRPCGRSCVCSSEPCPFATPRATPVRWRLLARLVRSFSMWFQRVLTSPSLHRDFSRHSLLSRRPHRESILRTSLFNASVTYALPCLNCRRRLTCAAQTFCHLRDAWLVLLSQRNVFLVWDLVLRSVDGGFDVELRTVRVLLEMSSQQLLVCELSP